MFGHKLRLSDSLYERLKKAAAAKGYSSAEEFALHILEKSSAEVDDSSSEEEVRNRLKGLGYLDG
ncbi:MAG: hypothetical protein WCL44_05040 [bacterium]